MPHTIQRLIGKTFTLENSGHISAAAFREIRDFICRRYDRGLSFVEPILADVGTALTITDKKACAAGVTGSYAKRLATAFHKADMDITDDDKARIGELATRWTTKRTLYGKVVEKIDWDSGDFGDSGSCFWSDRAVARKIITLNGGGAVVLFSDEELYDGRGRALLLPVPDLGYVLFNAYGDASLEAIAAGMAAAYGTGDPYPINLTEGGVWRCDDFWINGGKGIVLPTVDKVIAKLDLDLTRPHRCVRCSAYDGERNFSNPDSPYCDRCAERLHTCSRCDAEGFDFDRDPEDNTLYICPMCHELVRPSCVLCDEHVGDAELVWPKRGRYWFSERRVCRRCARHHNIDLEPEQDAPPAKPAPQPLRIQTMAEAARILMEQRQAQVPPPEIDVSPWNDLPVRYTATQFTHSDPSWINLPDFFSDEEESESE